MDKLNLENAARQMLIALGEDINREGLKDTPRRVAGYWMELLEGSSYTNADIGKLHNKLFKTNSNAMVIKEIKNLFSHCEHHLALMYNMRVVVAYIPKANDDGTYSVIGLSKIPRIVNLCTKRLQLQEKIATDVVECMQIATESNDIYVYVESDHACVSARGAKSDGKTVVTHYTGRFNDIKVRKEVELYK